MAEGHILVVHTLESGSAAWANLLHRLKIVATLGILEKLFVEIDKVESLGGTSYGGVEPAHHISCHRLVAKQTAVDKYRLPLSSLRLVAGHGIGKFNLQGVVVVVVANLLQSLNLALDVEVVLLDLSEELFALLTRERG